MRSRNYRWTCFATECSGADMDSEPGHGRAHFVGKWLQREPEMQFALVFCTGRGRGPRQSEESAREGFEAWGALLHELRETLFELSDARVSRIKTEWWSGELAGLAAGTARHPLTASLRGLPQTAMAPWPRLARTLLEHDFEATPALDTAGAIDALLPLAESVIAVESALFERSPSPAHARSLAVHWLLHRLPAGLQASDQARLPMQMLARHGLAAAQLGDADSSPLLRDWGRELAAAQADDVPGASYFRRSRHRFDRARLQRLQAGAAAGEPPAPASLWRAWRAALAP